LEKVVFLGEGWRGRNIEHRTSKGEKGFGFTAETRRSLRDAKFFEVKRNAEGSEVAEGDAEEEKRMSDWG
jgi:hypothetical protein